jgi:benzodiazapine receptor
MKYFKQSQIVPMLLCLFLGMLSGYISNGGISHWYLNLEKPSFNPPGWVFGPVWTILYLMMGFVLAKLLENRAKYKSLLIIFAVQMIYNLIWSPLFFRFQRVDLALIDIVLLWSSIALFIYVAFLSKERILAILFVPYLLWVSFASILNFSIYYLNY